MKKHILISLLLFAVHALYGGTSYTVYSNFTVRDNTTGLVWTRCSLVFDGAQSTPDCSGSVGSYGWEEAVQVCGDLNFGGRSDWRLPSIRELQSIVYYHQVIIPSINHTAFPSTVSDHYWSSTYHTNDTNMAWTIDFKYGSTTFKIINEGGILNTLYVRCVAGPDE